MPTRQPLYTVATPFPPTPTVTLYDNTWSDHIELGHPEMAGKQSNVVKTLQSPSYVCEASRPAYVMFVNQTDVDPTGAPHVVCVSPTTDKSGAPVVVTSYFDKRYNQPSKFKQIWP